jgi:hypothetical protein
VICLGLLVRSHRTGLPSFWTKYSGDALWALVVFLLVGALLRRKSTIYVATAAFLYSCATEFSQLYHAPWIDAVRRVPIGRLVLGDTFAWADMLAYLAGILIGAILEAALTRIDRSLRSGTK